MADSVRRIGSVGDRGSEAALAETQEQLVRLGCVKREDLADPVRATPAAPQADQTVALPPSAAPPPQRTRARRLLDLLRGKSA